MTYIASPRRPGGVNVPATSTRRPPSPQANTDPPAGAGARGRASPAGTRAHRSLLRPLGIVGYDAIEPPLLAALATEEPLLLISDHGAAKTLLLVRLAEALGVELRHYNASLIQFDDLAGFPIPDERGGIRYASPPGAIWGAEAVFFDEIGRCRPEAANKLFPIIHERRIQGIELTQLRHRWAATNPPAEALDADHADDPYEGVEPLDPALADRFSYIVAVPRFAELSDADRAAVIRGVGEAPDEDAAAHVRELVSAARDLLAARAAALVEQAVTYVLALTPLLAKAGVTIGGRRAAALGRNIPAVWAACLALGRPTGSSAFAAALLASIPETVRRPIPRSVLLAAHKAAWEHVALEKDDPAFAVRAVADPLRRSILAVTLPGLAAAFRGEALCDALAATKQHEREILSWLLLPRLLDERIVPATAVETIGEIVARVAAGGHEVRGFGTAREWVSRARGRIADSELGRDDAEYLFAVVCRAFPPATQLSGSRDDRSWTDPVDTCLAIWRSCAAALGGPPRAANEPPPAKEPSQLEEVA